MTSLLAVSGGLLITVFVILALIALAAILDITFLRARSAAREHEAAAAEATGAEGGVATAMVPAPAATAKPAKAPRVVTRREFFRTAWTASFLLFLAEFGAASIAFLWPNLKGGFGSTINAGSLDDIRSFIQSQKQPYYVGVGRFYVWFYGSNYQGIDTATGVDYTADGYVADGFMAIYQRCAHLGCRVPFCTSSQWFECPCHGSKYNIAGEYQLGPAPQGLQRFAVKVENNNLIVDTSGTAILGPPRGTDTVHEPPQGPFCV